MSRSRTRLIVMLAVVALHLVFLFVIQRLRLHQQERTADASRPLILVPVETPRVPEQPPQRTQEEDAPRPAHRPAQIAPPLRAPNAEPPDVPSPPRQIDWRGNALRSAEIVAERSFDEKYRSFGPRKQPSPGEAPAPSVFGPGPKHKRGDVETVGGDPVVWINGSCYMELDKPVQTARDWALANPGQFAPPQMRCEFVGAGPNGELFEHIKKREEPPVPKVGIEMKELPEREVQPSPSSR